MLTTQRTVFIICCMFVTTFLLIRPPAISDVPDWKYASFSSKDDESTEGMNRTLGFGKIFVINLPERTDRRDAMTLATTFTDLDVEWINGWSGHEVLEKVLPGDSWDKQISYGNRGSWRAHMDALREVIVQNLTTALILEDDADWDIRIKSQMQTLTRATCGYLQPVRADPTRNLVNLTAAEEKPIISIVDLPETIPPQTSPYGDNWDVLWLGHCGTEIPNKQRDRGSRLGQRPSVKAEERPRQQLPLLQITIPNDDTVPRPENLKGHPFALLDPLGTMFPPHTRVVHASSKTTCTQAYAVSQQGARKLLWKFGLETLTSGWDFMLRDWCDGVYVKMPQPRRGKDKKEGGDQDAEKEKKKTRLDTLPVCVTVQPPLFSHHFGKGAASDITAPGGGFVGKDKEMTPYVRLSVRMNMARLARGDRWGDLVDQWPDEK